jgi:hypothetical protein
MPPSRSALLLLATAAATAAGPCLSLGLCGTAFPRSRSTCDVTQAPFAAVGDGKHDDTVALRRALLHCDAVLLPRGKTFLTGPLNLTSHQSLVVDGTLLASQNHTDYPLVAPLVSYGWSIDSNCRPLGDPSHSAGDVMVGMLNHQPVVGAFNATNITVTGAGVIDGQGQPWWETCTKCHYKPPVGDWPNANASCLEAGRPTLMQFTFVSGLRVHGESVNSPLTLQNSPFWTLVPTYSQSIEISDLIITAPADVIGNTDGIDISSSRDATIRNVLVSNSDDGIALNSGAMVFGMNLAIPTENVLVHNLTCPGRAAATAAFLPSGGGQGGFRIGIVPGGCRNVTFRDSVLEGERGIMFTGECGGGGYINDILFDNITNPRGISWGNYNAACNDRQLFPGNDVFLPKVWNIEFRDIVDNGPCGNCERIANGSVCPNVTYTGITRCGSRPPPPSPSPPPPPLKTCPNRAYGRFVPWVRVQNASNVYRQIPRPFNTSSPGLPFLGLFDTVDGCQSACEGLSNCTQYSWSLNVPEFERHCYGRCDTVWVLHPVPPQYTVVAARRVAVGGSRSHSHGHREPAMSEESPMAAMRYGCKRSATDQFGVTFTLPWPVCIPLGAPVNVNKSWPNWGPVVGDYSSLTACKSSGCV